MLFKRHEKSHIDRHFAMLGRYYGRLRYAQGGSACDARLACASLMLYPISIDCCRCDAAYRRKTSIVWKGPHWTPLVPHMFLLAVVTVLLPSVPSLHVRSRLFIFTRARPPPKDSE